MNRYYAKVGVILLAIICFNLNSMDMREFGKQFDHNKQDSTGNTFWHDLARESVKLENWSQVVAREVLFKEQNKNWLPNPFIQNAEKKTARQEAKLQFKQTGNPVCGLLAVHLRQLEEDYLNKLALKENRESMEQAQHHQYPDK